MPWQERDWAKWTDEERNRYLGTSSTGRRTSSRRGFSGRPTVAQSRLNRPLSRHQAILAGVLIVVCIGYAGHKVLNGPTLTGIQTPPRTRIAVPMTGIPSTIRRGTY